jgi:hypothetical protein
MVLPVFALIIDVLRGAVGGHFSKKTVSTQIVARNRGKTSGKLRFAGHVVVASN